MLCRTMRRPDMWASGEIRNTAFMCTSFEIPLHGRKTAGNSVAPLSDVPLSKGTSMERADCAKMSFGGS